MGLRIYNTLDGAKKVFLPINRKIVKMFVCGPTMYYDIHVGHARSYVFFDIVARYLKWKGYKVVYVQNITNLSEKIVRRAKELGLSPEKVAKMYEKEYYKDAKKINVISVNRYVPSSSCAKQAVSQIQRLLKKGYAYNLDNNIYYDTSKFSDYPKLAHKSLNQLRKKIKNQNPKCRNKGDFILWMATEPEESGIRSPFGFGRPGWHIQDTAIAEKTFGQLQYDIHGGGVDLIFPHHSAQIAQLEAISGKKPSVSYWMHNRHLLVNGTKMSKSLNNFFTVKQALKIYKSQVLRLFLASSHYRKQMNYTKNNLRKSQAIYKKFILLLSKLRKIKKGKSFVKKQIIRTSRQAEKKFLAAMDDDFNIPKAIKAMLKYAANISKLIDNMRLSDRKLVLLQLQKFDHILGLNIF